MGSIKSHHKIPEYDIKEWVNCVTPDCQWKRCIWSGTELCSVCFQTVYGYEEWIRRYNLTHERTFTESECDGKPNYMVGIYVDK